MDRYSFETFADVAIKNLNEELKTEQEIDAKMAHKCLDYALNAYSALITPGYLKNSQKDVAQSIWNDVFNAYAPEIQNLPTLSMLNDIIRSK